MGESTRPVKQPAKPAVRCIAVVETWHGNTLWVLQCSRKTTVGDLCWQHREPFVPTIIAEDETI